MYSESAEGAGILHRIEQEGNEVSLYIHDPIYKDCWEGLINKAESLNPGPEDILIFDISGNGKIADSWIKSGHKVFGASSFADDLEMDREFGFSQMVAYGIKVPSTKTFKSFKTGMEYVRKSNKRLVFKPNGSMPCKLTFVSSDSEELIAYMEFVEKVYGSKIEDFILQDFIEGAVVSSEAFCDGKKFLHPFNHTVEVKKSMNDELGPSTGCSGNVTWACDGCRICDEGISKIEDLMVRNGYIGQIDLNAVVNEEGIYGLEWTPRMGYDASPVLLTLLECEYSKFFSDLVNGQMKEIPISYDFAGSVRFTVPPYPVELMKGKDPEKFSPSESIPIQKWEKHQENLYFYEVRCDEGRLVHSSGTGVIGLAFDQNIDPNKVLDKPYKILKELHIPDLQYRTDLSKVLSKMVNEVEEYQ